MAKVRIVDIKNYRGIKELLWYPSPGINCLIGSGDSGKSTVLDAVEVCLGFRRRQQFTDADFYMLDVETPIAISITLGELDDNLKNLETYGMFVRGFSSETNSIQDEPANDLETVITLELTVTSDLEPTWNLVSERAEAQGLSRELRWNDRTRLAATRIGAIALHHLGWRRDSLLNRISDEPIDSAAALAKAARDARAAFGEQAQIQLGETLGVVTTTAEKLGIPIGQNVKAMLDIHSTSFTEGTISLHDENGVPLRGLGTGSTRLLIAGLQRHVATRSSVVLVDELEYGLEPHRIVRFLDSLGAKENYPPLQVFTTTHSAVALRELSGDQLFIVQGGSDTHLIKRVGTNNDIQGTIRLYPEAFLAQSVIVCEGATEVGLIRGLDQYRTANGRDAIAARGVALVDCGGGDPDRLFRRAKSLLTLGYRTSILRDNDTTSCRELRRDFVECGGMVFEWRDGHALEDELFSGLTDDGVIKVLEEAIKMHGEELINDQLKSTSNNSVSLESFQEDAISSGITTEIRTIVGKAAKSKMGWFKTITRMEELARDIVGPDIRHANSCFRDLVKKIFAWVDDSGT